MSMTKLNACSGNVLIGLLAVSILLMAHTGAEESPVSATAAASAQAAAMKKYPSLGVAGSAFNREFLARVQRARTETPGLFDDPSWPLSLADEVARALPQPHPAAPDRIVLQGRTAVAPVGIPPAIERAVAAGNILQTRSYKYGGGRDTLEDWGYDCSGSVSYVLIKSGLLDEPRTSRSFATYGEPGPGRWLTVYASPGHVFITVCGLRLDTGGRGGVGERGPRWNPHPRSSQGYVLRHPPGF